MSYVNLVDMLKDAKERKYAVGAFNIVDYVTTAAVIKAAENKKSPIIIQTSAKTVKLFGYEPIVNWVKTLAVKTIVPVALNLDHCKDLDMIKNCIEAGWSSVMIDASTLPFEKNIEMTKEVVKMAKNKGVSVEGELGSIAGVEDDIFINEQEAHMANPKACLEFINLTGIDVLAPAIGTAHGIYQKEPNINFELLGEIYSTSELPIVIHGGTGLSNEVFKKCIQFGGSKINISTSIKYIFKDTIERHYRENLDDYEPIKVLSILEKDATKNVEGFMEMFESCNRIEG